MYSLSLPKVNHQFVRKANGVTRFGLGISSIKHATIKIPGLQEQQKIAAVLQTADREIALLRQKLAALQQQKKGLMQKLLMGKVRVTKLLEKR